MKTLHKSNSYPERLKDACIREHTEIQNELIIQTDVVQKFKHKDMDRAVHFAQLGSPSSADITIHDDCKTRCCMNISRLIDYWLEREITSKQQDESIRKKSYAGFYYFIKWFSRALFFMIFTTLGTIAGKELGCEIKDHTICKSGVIELVNSSPHIIASIIGSIVGLLLGQTIGRFIWDSLTTNIQHCLRRIEKKADRSKAFLIIISLIFYTINTILFSLIFFYFVDLDQDDNNIIGGIVGGGIGLFCAIGAYRKASSCRSGEATPMINPTQEESNPPILIIT